MIEMKHYNGFTGQQRAKAQEWLNGQWRAGTLKRPSRCCACGQEKGVLHAHAEDYSEPFRAGKTDQYHLCYACHMMVHCRFGRGAEAFARYADLLARGRRVLAFMTADWYGFKTSMLGSVILRPHEDTTPNDLLRCLFLGYDPYRHAASEKEPLHVDH